MLLLFYFALTLVFFLFLAIHQQYNMLKWSISYLDAGHTWQESRIHMKMPLQYESLDWKLMSKILEKSYIHQFQKNWLIKHYMEKDKMMIVITKLLQNRESWHGVLSNSSPTIKMGKTKSQWMSTEVAWIHKIT